MSFSESSLLKKLQELNSSQQSVQTLSLWLIHHRRFSKIVVNTWLKQLQLTPKSERKITFMYLANDILQNSRKKGDEYLNEFATVLAEAIDDASRVSDSKTRFSIERILNIWKDRKIYRDDTIEKYRKILHSAKPINGASSPSTGVDFDEEIKPTSNSSKSERTKSTSEAVNHSKLESVEAVKKRRMSTPDNSRIEPTIQAVTSETKKAGTFREEIHRELVEKGANVVTPDANELISMLQELEKSASSDAVVRQRIADLPTKVTDLNEIKKLQSKQEALDLVKTVNEAMSLLDSYNSRLQLEMVTRRKTALQLAAFIRQQQQEMENDKKLIEEWQKKFKQVMGVKRELETHLESLPDLTSIDAVAELTPLPSAGELFK